MKHDMRRLRTYLLPILLLAALVGARFVYAAINPVTGDSVFYSLAAEFFSREGRFMHTEIDQVGIMFLSPSHCCGFNIVSAIFFKVGEFFGEGRFFTKLVPPLAGGFTILLTYLLALRLSGRRSTALLAAIIFASLPLTLYMSTVIYIDMFLTFLVTANLYFFVLATKKKEPLPWTWVAISLAFALLTKLTAVSLLATYALFSIFLWHKGKEFRKLLCITMIASIVFSLWLGYEYLSTGEFFLPESVSVKTSAEPISVVVPTLFKYIKYVISDFWIGVPFSHDSIPHYFSIFFGSFASTAYLVATVFWVALSLVFLLSIQQGVKASAALFRADNRNFINLFLIVFSVMFVSSMLNFVSVEPQNRYLLPALPLMSIYSALGLERLFGKFPRRLMQFSGILLILLFLIQIGAGVTLTAKRVGGWDGCFNMIKNEVPSREIVFYDVHPDWIIYYTGVRAYGWDAKIPGASHPYNHSLMFELRTSEFVSYLKSYNTSYIYIDTGESCGGDPAKFYCAEFADSLEKTPSVQKLSSCTNKNTGGWGVLYRIK